MYRVSFEVIVEDPEYARRLLDEFRVAGIHIDNWHMEFINDIQHVHMMNGNTMAVRGVPDRPRSTRERFSGMSQEDIENYARTIARDLDNDQKLDELLSEEEPDFLDEKDMEL